MFGLAFCYTVTLKRYGLSVSFTFRDLECTGFTKVDCFVQRLCFKLGAEKISAISGKK